MENIEIPDTDFNAGDGESNVTSCVTLPTDLAAAASFLAIFGTDRQLCILDASDKMKGLRGSGMLLAAHKRNLNQEAVYFTPNTVVAEVNKKPTSAEITNINAFYIDVDWGWSVNGGNFPAAHAAVMLKAEGLKALSCPPSVIVSTGGGIQAFWITSEPLAAKEFKARAVELNKTLAGMFGGDAVHSIDHAFRLPGFVNYPKKKKRDAGQLAVLVTVIFESDRRYTIGELETAFLHGGNIAPGKKKTAVASPESFPDSLPESFWDSPLRNGGDTGVNDMAEGIGPNMNEIASLSAALDEKLGDRDTWIVYVTAMANLDARHSEQHDEIVNICNATCAKSPGYNETEVKAKYDEMVGYAHARIAAGDTLTGMTTLRRMSEKHGWVWSPDEAQSESDAAGGAAGGAGDAAGGARAAMTPEAVVFTSSNAPNSIPHRRWLHGVDLVKGEVTVLAAPGGSGKSAHALAMALAVASGRTLLGSKVYGGAQPALFISAEDDLNELRRRGTALQLQHKLTDAEMNNLLVIGASEAAGVWLTTGDENRATIDHDGFKVIDRLLKKYAPALLVLDPLGLLCPSGINNNGLMAQVMMHVKQNAIRHQCAVLAVHHTKKGEDKTSADSIAGASAIVNHARIASTMAQMTEKEGEGFGLLPTEICQHYKIISAKMNLAKPSSADDVWFELASITLGNAEPPVYIHGDNVQAVRRAMLAPVGLTLDAGKLLAYRFILDFANSTTNGIGTGDPFSLHPKGGGAKSRSLLGHVAQPLAHKFNPNLSKKDAAAFAKRYIDDLMHREWLVSVSPSKRSAGALRNNSCAVVNWDKTPWADEFVAPEDGCAPAAAPTEANPKLGAAPQDSEAVMADFARRIERGEK